MDVEHPAQKLHDLYVVHPIDIDPRSGGPVAEGCQRRDLLDFALDEMLRTVIQRVNFDGARRRFAAVNERAGRRSGLLASGRKEACGRAYALSDGHRKRCDAIRDFLYSLRMAVVI